MVSHEFRNPLNNIFACTELLTDHNHKLNEAKKDEYLNHIQNSVQHLEHLLSDILLIGKAEIDKSQFHPELLDVEKFCKNLVADIKLGASVNHKIIFTVQGSSISTDNTIIAPNSKFIYSSRKFY